MIKTDHIDTVKAGFEEAFGAEPKLTEATEPDSYGSAYLVIDKPITGGEFNILNQKLQAGRVPNEVQFKRSGTGIKVFVE